MSHRWSALPVAALHVVHTTSLGDVTSALTAGLARSVHWKAGISLFPTQNPEAGFRTVRSGLYLLQEGRSAVPSCYSDTSAGIIFPFSPVIYLSLTYVTVNSLYLFYTLSCNPNDGITHFYIYFAHIVPAFSPGRLSDAHHSCPGPRISRFSKEQLGPFDSRVFGWLLPFDTKGHATS